MLVCWKTSLMRLVGGENASCQLFCMRLCLSVRSDAMNVFQVLGIRVQYLEKGTEPYSVVAYAPRRREARYRVSGRNVAVAVE